MLNIDLSSLDVIPPLSSGSHNDLTEGACVMEAVAFIAGEPWSDRPACACPVISVFLRSWNDALPDADRDVLLRPLIPTLIGTRGSGALEHRRAFMAADWLVRVHTPAWLRLAKLDTQADALASLPEITDTAQCPSLMPTLSAVRHDAAAARVAAWDAAWGATSDATRVAAWEATRVAAWEAASEAAWDAAWEATSEAASEAAWDAASEAAWDATSEAARVAAWEAASEAASDATRVAAWEATRVAAWEALNQTRLELQQSALALVERMIAARDEEGE